MNRRSANDHTSREAWLRAATNELRPHFTKLGLTIPEAIRFSIAFTSLGKKSRVAGEVWPAAASADGIDGAADAREVECGSRDHDLFRGDDFLRGNGLFRRLRFHKTFLCRGFG